MFFNRNNNLFFRLKLKNHYQNKHKIIEKMKLSGRRLTNESFNSYESFISFTDWCPYQSKVNWWQEAISDLDKERIINFLFKKYKKSLVIDKYWFNQYDPNSGSEHDFHIHPNCDLVMIYFVELNDMKLTTILYDEHKDKRIVPRVNEGDLLIFSSKTYHSSPRNFTKTRKSIISFNISFFDHENFTL